RSSGRKQNGPCPSLGRRYFWPPNSSSWGSGCTASRTAVASAACIRRKTYAAGAGPGRVSESTRNMIVACSIRSNGTPNPFCSSLSSERALLTPARAGRPSSSAGRTATTIAESRGTQERDRGSFVAEVLDDPDDPLVLDDPEEPDDVPEARAAP